MDTALDQPSIPAAFSIPGPHPIAGVLVRVPRQRPHVLLFNDSAEVDPGRAMLKVDRSQLPELIDGLRRLAAAGEEPSASDSL